VVFYTYKLIFGILNMRTNFRAAVLSFMVASMATAYVSPATAQSKEDPALNILASDLPSYSRYYAPYAIQSAAAYLSFKQFDKQPDDTSPMKIDNEGYGDDVKYAVQGVFGGDPMPAREAIREWQYQFGNDGAPLKCIDVKDNACKDAYSKRGWEFGSGPVYHVWARQRFPHAGREECTEISIAFRGTVGWNRWDWTSNAARYATPYDDYYHQLQRNINAIVNQIRNLDCYKRARHAPQIVSTGHSLGAGLAQFVALANKRIRKVFAFDPSPVTGAHLIDKNVLRANVQGLTIDRIAQYGEVLSYPRRLVEEYPPAGSPCNPVVRTVNVDAVRGGAVDLHMINPLAARIVDLTYDRGRQVSYGEPDAPAGCNVRDNSDEVASAGGQRRLVAFKPNYGGYADQLGASYPDVQQDVKVAKLPAARMQRMAMVARGQGSKRTGAINAYKQVAQFESAPSFVQLVPAQ
jgi:hypothetical protein